MDQKTLIKAKWLLPVSHPPIEDGYLLVSDGKITETGTISDLKKQDFHQRIDCSSHIVMPGLVNAHTHLELSNLKGKIKEKSFTGWIRALLSETQIWKEEDYRLSVDNGIDGLIQSGATTVGDISRTGLSCEILRQRGMRGVVFLEVLGVDLLVEGERMNEAKKRLLPMDPDRRVNFGISPHAPYSTSRDLFIKSHRYASKHNIPVSIHCSETEEEFEFIQKGTGEIKRMLEDFGLFKKDWSPPGISPVAYLNEIGVLKDIAGIHMNIVDEDDIALLSANRVSVVSCPGSNRWFNRKRICPIDCLLKSSINVSLGTDSLASNSSLNLFSEMRYISEYFPRLSCREILEMATMRGAVTLGLDKEIGSLEKNKFADIISIKLPESRIDDPEQYIVENAEKIDLMMIEGETIFSAV